MFNRSLSSKSFEIVSTGLHMIVCKDSVVIDVKSFEIVSTGLHMIVCKDSVVVDVVVLDGRHWAEWSKTVTRTPNY